MNDADVARFEAQAAETVGAMKELFAEFERRLGEVVAAQRLAASEARDEGVKVRAALETIARQARALAESQRQAIDEIRNGWRMHVAENSKAAGAEMARSFGHEIAGGLEQRLGKLGDAVDRVTRRFQWVTALKWGAGGVLVTILALSLAANMLIRSVAPSVDGLSDLQVRRALMRLVPCYVGPDMHVCATTDAKVRAGKGPGGEVLPILKGM